MPKYLTKDPETGEWGQDVQAANEGHAEIIAASLGLVVEGIVVGYDEVEVDEEGKPVEAEEEA